MGRGCLFRKKSGFYDTRATHWFSRREGADVINGSWVPWNPTIKTTLKEIKNPIPLYYKNRYVVYVPKGEAVGFDCAVGDLAVPHGKGAVADFLFTYTADRGGETLAYVTNELVVAIQDGGGFYTQKKDMGSKFQFEYTAPLEGYQEEVFYEFARTADKIYKDTTLPKDEYLIFRSRIETGDDGNVTNAHYGLIASLQQGESYEEPNKGTIILEYYFNSTPNDKNLEYGSNLFDEKKRK